MTIITTAIALALVSATLTYSAPIAKSLSNKFTCKDKDSYTRQEWRSCIKNGDTVYDGDVVSYDSLNLPSKLLRNEIELLQVPENSFKCYRAQRYTYESLQSPSCPSACRLTHLKEVDDCPVSNLVVHENGEVLVAKSPRYGCSDYLKNEICVYNISMSCQDSSHLTISETASHMDVAHGDFLHIIVDDTHQYHLSGDLLTQHELHSTNFLMVFWSGNDRYEGEGFKLQFQCPLVIDYEYSGDGSGE